MSKFINDSFAGGSQRNFTKVNSIDKLHTALANWSVISVSSYMLTRRFAIHLRALVGKNQTYRGKGGKFDFFLILMLDRLGYN